MKQLLTTIAAVVLAGCGEWPKNIWEAVEQGDIEAVRQHLASGTDVDAKSSRTGSTPLHFATNYGRKEIAELLISKSADVNPMGGGGKTPLSYAVGEGHKEIVELLIANGADVNAKGTDETSPLHFAAMNGHTEIAELLIDKGADVNAKDEDGETPLDWAISQYQNKAFDLLRKHGGKTKKELEAAGN